METIVYKMREVALKHYRKRYDRNANPDSMLLTSYKLLNGDFECFFTAGHSEELVLYQIIWYRDYNEYRVFCFRMTEMYDTND